MTSTYDALIIGAGQAGPPLAGRLTAAGMSVAVDRAQALRRHLRQYGLHPDQNARRQRLCRASGAPRNGVWRQHRSEVAVDMKAVKARKDMISTRAREGRRILA